MPSRRNRGRPSEQWEGRDPIKPGDIMDWMVLVHAGANRTLVNPSADVDEYIPIPVTIQSKAKDGWWVLVAAEGMFPFFAYAEELKPYDQHG